MYNKRTWLNPNTSPSMGSAVAFDGLNEGVHHTFLAISDCKRTIFLSKTEDDTIEDFIDKMKLLRSEIDEFIKHIENEKSREIN